MDTKTISNAPSDVSDEEAIARFADQLIEEKGLGGLEEADKKKLREEISEKFIDRVNEALIFALPDDRFKEMKELLDKADAENADGDETMKRIGEIVESANLDMKKIVTETAEDFRRIFLEGEGEEA